MKNWRSFFRESLTKDSIHQQMKPGSQLWRIFIFSLVAAISTGVLYSFVSQYIVGSRAAEAPVTVTTGPSKPNVAVNEEFKVNVVFAAADDKKISQLDLRLDLPVSTSTGDVEYIKGKAEASGLGGPANYFDTVVLEQADGAAGAAKKVRLVLSSRRPETELKSNVTVSLFFKATKNGKVDFKLDRTNMEIVGPGGENVPTTFTFGSGSTTDTSVMIGEGPTATPVPPTTGPSVSAPSPTITIAPPPGCNSAQAMNCKDVPVSMIITESTIS